MCLFFKRKPCHYTLDGKVAPYPRLSGDRRAYHQRHHQSDVSALFGWVDAGSYRQDHSSRSRTSETGQARRSRTIASRV